MKLFGSLAFGSLCLADISFDGAEENYVQEIGTDFIVEIAVNYVPDVDEELTVVLRAEANGAEKEHKFFKLRAGKDPIQYDLESDVEDIYRLIDGQIAASIEDDGTGSATFSANLTSVSQEFDATEFTVEADLGQFSDSTSFLLSAYKLPVIEATLLEDTVNENLGVNDTVKLIECAILEPGYAPIEKDFSVTEETTLSIGELELDHDVDVNDTSKYIAYLTSGDIATTAPGKLDGAKASCQFQYSFLSDHAPSQYDESADTLTFKYDPTYVNFEPEETLINKYNKYWGKANDQVTVTCEADGNPKPELVISVDGSDISGAGQDETSRLSTTHTISDSGEQTVTCEISGPNSHNAVADPLTFDYHYLKEPVLKDTRVNVTANVFRAGEDSKNSIQCSADSRPEAAMIQYKTGDTTFDRAGKFAEAANLTITCIATNLLSNESKKTTMRIQVLPPLVPPEPESGGANIVVIIIVVLLVILLLGAIAFFIIKKRRESESEASADGYTEGQPKPSDGEHGTEGV